MALSRISLAIVYVALTLVAVGPACAQAPVPAPPATGSPANFQPEPLMLADSPGGAAAGTTVLSSGWAGPTDAQTNTWVGPNTESEGPAATSGWFAGADFLLVRPHFSEATAFAQGTQTTTSLHITAQDLDFQYNPSFRVFAGYRFEGTDTELRFTYTRMTDQTEADAGNFAAGHFAVDPFGNVAGVAFVVNPTSGNYGTQITGGDRIRTSAEVDANVFDLDLIKPLMCVCGGWELKYTAGVRIAQVHQMYQSVISESGSFFSGGEYTADFTGAGPRVGFQALRYFGRCRQFSLYANTYGSLLVGEYDMHFGQSVTSPVAFQATQDTDDVRVIPVAEAEIGGGWSPIPWFNVSAGWLFQTWFDLGGSGGTFGGFYTVTENSNIMAFEGFFLRAELTF